MGPGDHAFIRWAKRFISVDDAKRVCGAYKKASLITTDNHEGSFRVLDFDACHADALEAAAENLRPARSRRRGGWNQLTDEQRQRLVTSKRTTPELWERQERIELAMLKLDSKRNP